MNNRYYSWYVRVLETMRWVLSPYLDRGIDRPTGENENFRAFYLIDAKLAGKSKNEGFIVHLNPTTDFSKINVCFGKQDNKLKIPSGYPRLRPGDGNQCQYDIYSDRPYDWSLAFLLAVQVAEIKSRELGLK